MRKIIKLDDINVGDSPSVRAEYRHEISEEYAEQYKLKTHTMPECVLFKVGKEYLIGDGMHRINGMKIAGLKMQSFDVREGTRSDCVKFALQSNISHGIRRTNADKRQCVSVAMKEFSSLSDGQISELCGVGNDLVKEVRAMMESVGEIKHAEKRIGKDGKQYKSPRKADQPKDAEDEDADEEDEDDEDEDSDEEDESVPSSGPVMDGTKKVRVTEKAMPFWNRRGEAAVLIKHIGVIKSALKKAKETKDVLYNEVVFASIENDLERARYMLMSAIPYAVCWACSGVKVETCTLCNGKGMLSKHKHEQTIPPDIRKIRDGA